MKYLKLKHLPGSVLGGIGGAVGSLTVSARRKRFTRPLVGSADVFLIKTSDRRLGVRELLKRFDLKSYHGKTVAMKANFNSADPFPASTHIDTLEAIVVGLKEAGIRSLTLAERSGMGNTRKVLEKSGVFDLSKKLGFDVVVLDEVGRDGWTKIDPSGTHWLNGFYISNVFLRADKVVQTCCLKTHRFGGHFTLSLKNSVGLVAKHVPGVPYDFMAELHTSPFQRSMIAEVNGFYKVDMVIMDAIKGFISGGPDRGDVVEPGLMLASSDRVAIDAVGLAILKAHGATKGVEGEVFKLEQIRRAAEIGVGVKSAAEIELIPLNDECSDDANKIESILRRG
jgi:uncharacterized protein (DUF362 family)